MIQRVTLSERARRDADAAIAKSVARFGDAQAIAYAALIDAAIKEIEFDPFCPRSKAQPELGADVRTLRIARRGRRAVHALVYCVRTAGSVEVVRVLHEKMDFPRHLFSGAEADSDN